MKMFPEGVDSHPHLRNHTRYLRLNEGLSLLDHTHRLSTGRLDVRLDLIADTKRT